MRALLLLALAASTAAAQTTYTFSGCDTQYGATFGPGPRLCATATVRLDPVLFGPWRPVWADVTVTTHTTFLWADGGGTSEGPTDFPGITRLPPNDDAFHAQDCNTWTCSPGTYALTAGTFYADPAWVPTGLHLRAWYLRTVSAGVPLGITDAAAWPAHYAGDAWLTTTTPEPAGRWLTALGLVMLGVMLRWRVRR